MKLPRIYSLSEYALTVEFGDRIDPELNRRVIALRDSLAQGPFPGMLESVPAYASLTVFFDPARVKMHLPGNPAAISVNRILSERAERMSTMEDQPGSFIEIPVCYDISLAPDLLWVASYCGMRTEEVVRIHSSGQYRVYMTGFVPGFPYMGMTDPAIYVPRKKQPARSVPGGSVALAGNQTGIYPADIPGGWQVIGRTPTTLFDPDKDPCTTLHAGMSVSFKPVSLASYLEMTAHGITHS